MEIIDFPCMKKEEHCHPNKIFPTTQAFLGEDMYDILQVLDIV